MGGFVIPPLPPMLPQELQAAGPLGSTGITPLPRYYEPLRLETIRGKRGISIAASEIDPATATPRVLVSSRRYLVRRIFPPEEGMGILYIPLESLKISPTSGSGVSRQQGSRKGRQRVQDLLLLRIPA